MRRGHHVQRLHVVVGPAGLPGGPSAVWTSSAISTSRSRDGSNRFVTGRAGPRARAGVDAPQRVAGRVRAHAREPRRVLGEAAARAVEVAPAVRRLELRRRDRPRPDEEGVGARAGAPSATRRANGSPTERSTGPRVNTPRRSAETWKRRRTRSHGRRVQALRRTVVPGSSPSVELALADLDARAGLVVRPQPGERQAAAGSRPRSRAGSSRRTATRRAPRCRRVADAVEAPPRSRPRGRRRAAARRRPARSRSGRRGRSRRRSSAIAARTRPAMGQSPATRRDRARTRGSRRPRRRRGAVEAPVEVDDEPVREHGRRDGLDVVGRHERAAVEHRRRPARRGTARRSRAGWRRGRGPGGSRVARTTSTRYASTSSATRTVRDRRRGPRAAGRGRRRARSRRAAPPRPGSGGRSAAPRRRPGSPTRARSRNRSSWACGSANVPSNSTGFWVARTRNGSGRTWVVPSIETWRSCIASSSADWVRGVARLISSTSSRFVNTGPGTNRRPPGSNRLAPVTSDGSRSGVPWIRAIRRSRRPGRRPGRAASCRCPGTSSSRTWPSARSAMAISRSGSSAPTTARATERRRSSHSRRPAATTSARGARRVARPAGRGVGAGPRGRPPCGRGSSVRSRDRVVSAKPTARDPGRVRDRGARTVVATGHAGAHRRTRPATRPAPIDSSSAPRSPASERSRPCRCRRSSRIPAPPDPILGLAEAFRNDPRDGQDQPELRRLRGRDRQDPGPADGHRGRAPPRRRRGDQALPADRRRGRLPRARARAGPRRGPRGGRPPAGRSRPRRPGGTGGLRVAADLLRQTGAGADALDERADVAQPPAAVRGGRLPDPDLPVHRRDRPPDRRGRRCSTPSATRARATSCCSTAPATTRPASTPPPPSGGGSATSSRSAGCCRSSTSPTRASATAWSRTPRASASSSGRAPSSSSRPRSPRRSRSTPSASAR